MDLSRWRFQRLAVGCSSGAEPADTRSSLSLPGSHRSMALTRGCSIGANGGVLAAWQPWILSLAGPSVGSADTVRGRRDYRRRHCDALGIPREPFKRWIDRHDGNEPTGDSVTKPPKPSRFGATAHSVASKAQSRLGETARNALGEPDDHPSPLHNLQSCLADGRRLPRQGKVSTASPAPSSELYVSIAGTLAGLAG
jgi:hypothetical protein